MSGRRPALLAGGLGVLLVVAAAWGLHSARAAVTLLYFIGGTNANHVLLEWETATELDNAGFYVLRNQSGGNNPGNYAAVVVIDQDSGLPHTFIAARGDDLVGALYRFRDENVSIGSRYFYMLQDVDQNNLSSYHGPVEVVAGQTPTPTPSATTQGAGATATRTPTPTASRTPTASASAFATATASPSPTLSPTTDPLSATPDIAATAGTPDPGLSSVDLTLTAVYASVTQLPSATPTRTPAAVAQASPGAPSPSESPTETPPGSAASGPQNGSFARLFPVVLVFLASGGLLTWGVFQLSRRSRGEA